jgi:hypothetical protein
LFCTFDGYWLNFHEKASVLKNLKNESQLKSEIENHKHGYQPEHFPGIQAASSLHSNCVVYMNDLVPRQLALYWRHAGRGWALHSTV